MTSPLDPRVRDGWGAFNAPLEGRVSWMYLDVRGLVTTGLGFLVTSPEATIPLPWLREDGSLASPEQIDVEWRRVRVMPSGRDYHYYRGPLHLSDEAIDALAAQRVLADATILAARWPDLPTWPWQAQAALAALAWAVGAGSQPPGVASGAEWPHLHEALHMGDWRGAAAAGQLVWATNPGVRPRDMAVSVLFLLAAGASWDDARADWPAGPAVDAALRALAGLGLPEAPAPDIDETPTPLAHCETP